jgi:hypothetical protein
MKKLQSEKVSKRFLPRESATGEKKNINQAGHDQRRDTHPSWERQLFVWPKGSSSFRVSIRIPQAKSNAVVYTVSGGPSREGRFVNSFVHKTIFSKAVTARVSVTSSAIWPKLL